MRVGYYAHSQGSGHIRSAKKIQKFFSAENFYVFSSTRKFPGIKNFIELPHVGLTGKELVNNKAVFPKYLHYSPNGHPGLTELAHTLLNHISELGIQMMIVDVSVEVAVLMKVISIPFAYVYMHGDRTDIPHQQAFLSSQFLLGYYPAELSSPISNNLRQKLILTGFLHKLEGGSAFSNAESFKKSILSKKTLNNVENIKILTIITGFGGVDQLEKQISKLKTLFPDYFLILVGEKIDIDGVLSLGKVDIIKDYIVYSDIIAAVPGLNLTSEILNSGRKFISLPQWRYYDEQLYIQKALTASEYSYGLDSDFNQSIIDQLETTHDYTFESNKQVFHDLNEAPNMQYFIDNYLP